MCLHHMCKSGAVLDLEKDIDQILKLWVYRGSFIWIFEAMTDRISKAVVVVQ